MASATTKDKMEFAYLMAHHSGATMGQLQRLLRYGASYHSVQERHCNGDCPYPHLPTRAGGENCSKEMALEIKMLEIVKSWGSDFAIKFGGDPRGCTVKIVVPDGYTNDWGREGICVPTA